MQGEHPGCSDCTNGWRRKRKRRGKEVGSHWSQGAQGSHPWRRHHERVSPAWTDQEGTTLILKDHPKGKSKCKKKGKGEDKSDRRLDAGDCLAQPAPANEKSDKAARLLAPLPCMSDMPRGMAKRMMLAAILPCSVDEAAAPIRRDSILTKALSIPPIPPLIVR